MDFGKVLKRSWEIIWTHKVLWIFGVLASCGSRSGSGGGNVGNSFSGSTDSGDLPPQIERFFLDVQRAFERIPEDRLILYGLIFVFAILLLILVTWLVGLYGKTALISGVLQAENGVKLSFGQLWRDAWVPYGRVVGLNTILGLLAFLAAMLLVVPFLLFGAVTMGIGLICLIPFACLLIPLSFAYSVYSEVANVTAVKEGLGATDAMERAWQVFRNNLGNLALMAIVLIIGGFVVNIVIAIPLFIALAPLFAGLISGSEQSFGQGMSVFVICLVVYIPVLFVFNGIVQSYLQSAWTLTYNQIAAPTTVAPTRKPAAPRKTIARTSKK